MTTRKILVTGATGKQGGAVIKALLADPPPFDHEILALTRKTTSNSAKALASKPKVTLIEGDMDDCAAIFQKAGGVGAVWGVFCMTMPSLKSKEQGLETAQGNALVDAAIENKVKHIVYTSVDRGGPDASDVNATDVPHFVSKYKVENHLKEKCRGTDMTYTILRPVAFMDNLKPNVGGQIFAATWHTMGGKPLQLVAVKDIGIFGALAFANLDSDDYKNTAISLAGCDLTQAQAEQEFIRVLGRTMPRTYDFVGNVLMYMIAEVGIMFKWFNEVGYGADLAQCKRLNPKMLDFEGYLREESGFKR